MIRLFIPLLALAGIVWSVDATLRPYIDILMAVACAGVMFTLGDIVECRLAAWEAKPYWKKMPTSRARRQRRAARPHHWSRGSQHYSGKSTPLLER